MTSTTILEVESRAIIRVCPPLMAFPVVVAALINQKPKTAVLGTKVSGMKAVVFQWFLWYQLSMIFIHSLE